MARRVVRFCRFVWMSRRLIFRSPVDWHNLRASWLQSDPHWLSKLEQVTLTDEEADAFMAAIKEVGGGD